MDHKTSLKSAIYYLFVIFDLSDSSSPLKVSDRDSLLSIVRGAIVRHRRNQQLANDPPVVVRALNQAPLKVSRESNNPPVVLALNRTLLKINVSRWQRPTNVPTLIKDTSWRSTPQSQLFSVRTSSQLLVQRSGALV